jgi:4-hydroxy-4-methyl-2-oxoglutarate aldolase
MTEGIALRLRALGTATVGESGGAIVPPGLVPVWPGAAVAGPALPVRCAAGDNLAVHAAVANAAPGCVLVVVSDGDPVRGYWGEVLTVAAQARGIAGLVLDGGIRDAAEIGARGFPAFAAVSGLPGASKHGPGAVGHPVDLRGVEVGAGDWVVADRDGVVIVAEAALEAVVAAAEARAAKEAAMFAELEAGSTTLELLGIDVDSISMRDEPRARADE